MARGSGRGYGDTYDPSRDGRWFATVYVSEVDATEVVVDGRGDQGLCFGDSGSGLVSLDAEGNPVVLAVESNGDESCVDIYHMTRLDIIWDWIGPVLDGELPPDPCEGVGDEGRCDGNVAVSCRRGTLRETDCSIWGVECGYVDEAARYACACGVVTETGWCDGDVAEYCREGRISQMNCGTRGQFCGWVDQESRYACTDVATCIPEDEAGRCQGDTAIHCASDRTSRELCFMDGRVCLETAEGATCVDPGADGDADADADADGDADADADADGDDGGAGGDAGEGDSEGCSCRAAAPTPSSGGLLVLFSFLLGVGMRLVRPRRLRAGPSGCSRP